ncbi:uncharacterized protein LOC136070628 [Quercus suber]|uniref:uncharacterized protein LOC136070627 n=1 Tax=Quercus suber TaxID=58331 RepID=UPI0032DE7800
MNSFDAELAGSRGFSLIPPEGLSWEKKVKVVKIPVPAKKAPAKLKSLSKSKSATLQPPASATPAGRTRGSKRKTTPHPVFAAQQRSKQKEDTSAARPLMLEEPESEDEPEPLFVYRPTVEELSAPMGIPTEGTFGGVESAAPAPSAATTSPTRPVPTDEGTHIREVSEVTPTLAMRSSVQRGTTPPAVAEVEVTPTTPLIISTGDPFAALSQVVQGVSSLVVTPSSIPVSATRGSRAELSSEGFEEIFEDPEDEPVLGRRISEFEEEDSVPPEAMETFEGLSIAPSVSVPAVATPAVPTVPIPVVFSAPASAIFTASVSAIPSVPTSVLPAAPSVASSAPPPFVAGSSSATLPDPVSEAVAFFTRFDQPEVNDLDPAAFWGCGPPYVDFNGFRVLEDCVAHLGMIYNNHGDFMQGFRLGRSV